MRLLNALKVNIKIARHWKNSGGWENFLKQAYCTSANCEWWSNDVIRIICASTLCWNKPYHWLIPVHTTGSFHAYTITRAFHVKGMQLDRSLGARPLWTVLR